MLIWPNGTWVKCYSCGGNGINNGSTCWACGGAGGRWVNPAPYPYQPWPPRPPYNPPYVQPGGRWMPRCTCGQTTICPLHPNRSIC